jgi:preprotein translocase subunit SecB
MIEAKKAAFSFDSFKVSKFFYDEENHIGEDLSVGFYPKGKFNPATGEFEIILYFIAENISEKRKPVFDLTSHAVFKFNSPITLEQIPSFFYKNAIAIMFPYLRAFVSTLTLQANTKLLNLGLMNLSNLEEPLIKNTVIVEALES